MPKSATSFEKITAFRGILTVMAHPEFGQIAIVAASKKNLSDAFRHWNPKGKEPDKTMYQRVVIVSNKSLE